jgi:sulfoxide reductase heme-binding subunit YedZ
MKPALFALLALPLAFLGVDIAAELVEPGSRLGADPGQAVVTYLGEWSLWMLLAVLAVSTGRRTLGQPKLMRYRRMVGLFAFAYLCLHLMAYIGFLAVFDWRQIVEDVTDRPYISVGFLALLLLVPLAITSTNAWRARLGRRWVSLHRAVYPATALGILHHFWLTKDGYGESVLYLSLFVLLMLERLMRGWLSGRRSLQPDT